MEVPPGQDGGAEEDEAEGLVAAESAEIGGAACFGGFWVELRLGAGRHGISIDNLTVYREKPWRMLVLLRVRIAEMGFDM